MSRLEFFALGIPAPQGSKRAFRRGAGVVLVESSKAVGPWREAVKYASHEALGVLGFERLDGAVSVTVVFYMPRPKYHHGKDGTRKTSAPTLHKVKPDVDKLLRSTLDALVMSGVILDDAQVARVQASKVYADDRIGASVCVSELEERAA